MIKKDGIVEIKNKKVKIEKFSVVLRIKESVNNKWKFSLLVQKREWDWAFFIPFVADITKTCVDTSVFTDDKEGLTIDELVKVLKNQLHEVGILSSSTTPKEYYMKENNHDIANILDLIKED